MVSSLLTVRSKLFRSLVYALRIYIIIAVLLWFGQELLLFPMLISKVTGKSTPAPVPATVESFFIDTDDGEKLEVWTSYGRSPDLSSPYVGLIFHGNGETVAAGNYLPFFARHKIPAFTIDYRGYGNSTGWPGERTILSDSETFWRAVQERTGVLAKNVIILGNSIGSGPASYLASLIEPRALILIAGFSSLAEVLADIPSYSPFRWLLRYQFPNREYLQKLKTNCLILAHGMKDTTINFRHLDLLKQSASHPNIGQVLTLTSQVAGHNDIYYAVEEQLDRSLDGCLLDLPS